MTGAAACVRMQAAAPDENEMSIPRLLTRSAAEAVGTFILVFAAAGSVMVTELSNNQVSSLVPSFGSGLVVAAMVYVFGPISGAHINPAVTLALALNKHMPWRHTPAYWAAQIAGASARGGHTAADAWKRSRTGRSLAVGRQLGVTVDGDCPNLHPSPSDQRGRCESQQARQCVGRDYRRDGLPGHDAGGAGIRWLDEPRPLLRPRSRWMDVDAPLAVLGRAHHRSGRRSGLLPSASCRPL